MSQEVDQHYCNVAGVLKKDDVIDQRADEVTVENEQQCTNLTCGSPGAPPALWLEEQKFIRFDTLLCECGQWVMTSVTLKQLCLVCVVTTGGAAL